MLTQERIQFGEESALTPRGNLRTTAGGGGGNESEFRPNNSVFNPENSSVYSVQHFRLQ